MIMLVMAIICFITCIGFIIIRFLYDYCGEDTIGKITCIEVSDKYGLNDEIYEGYDYIYEYNDDKGQLYHGKMKTGHRVKKFSVGDSIQLRYLKFFPKVSVADCLNLKLLCSFMTPMTLFMTVVIIIIWSLL